jgi:choline dehydrogenase-like flavoprotein
MPLPDRIPSDDTLPVKADVVVIGGGIVGVATALELAERGIAVTLCEKAEIASEQSSRNWGWCRQMGRDPREIPLIVESLKAWRAINARVQAETGFRECGILYLCETDAEFAAKAAWFENNAKPYGLPIRPLAAPEVQELAPGATVKWKGALYSPRMVAPNLKWRPLPWPLPRGATVQRSSPNARFAVSRPPPAASVPSSPKKGPSPATAPCLLPVPGRDCS